MQIAAGAGDHHLEAGKPPQLRGDGRRVLVPLAGVADERQVRLHLLAVLGEEARQRRRAAFLLALEQHGDGERQPARHLLPGARRLQEGHQLALVVLRAARHDHLAVGLVVGDARLERRRLPQLQRIGRLHVVVAVEQHVRRRLAARPCCAGPPPWDGRWSAPRAHRSRSPAAARCTTPRPCGSAPCRPDRSRRSGCGSARTAAPAPALWFRRAPSRLAAAGSSFASSWRGRSAGGGRIAASLAPLSTAMRRRPGPRDAGWRRNAWQPGCVFL